MSSLTSTSQTVALAATSLGVGYALGVQSASKSSAASPPPVDKPPTPAEEDSDEEGEVADGDLSAVKPGFVEPCKLVLVVRTDLGMTPGKIAAHQAKIALKATSEEGLLELEAVAKSLNLCARAIHDAGRTQIAAGSRTVLGIGPGPVELVNRVTGKLRLL
ncbi:hypothetical protein EVJ58_g642 [Rhodofomes roseus]|uniref:peptidyl-tRNA hydrolase n=1 Tax=Rhodofomes roseus TaxID=34475 RepID=A0A4Y9Z390_9APHY|nr:hypothetical protein EVJ58_g642 [Rhodofomes roseus]